MLPRGATSVISNIYHIWEPYLTARLQYPDAKELHNPIELIVAEHDALADRLGRRFANGDGK